MTPEERQLLEGLFNRIKTAAPAETDKEADELIGKSMKDMPHAGYVLSQAVIVQEEALKAAVAKIEELEGHVEELETKASQNAGNSSFLGGIGKSLFGGNEPPERPNGERSSGERSFGRGGSGVPSTRSASGISVPPPPGAQGSSAWTHQGAAPAGQQAAGGGGTFLKGALGAAAGVAGGMLLANAVGGLFSGKNNPLGISSANASENKTNADATAGDDWGDDKSASNDDWKEDNADTGADDWGDDNGDDWGDSGGDDGGSWD